jgi:phage repressor protein C with HTH and peptisase S24 domain
MIDKQQEVRDFLENTIKDKGLSLNSLSLQIGKNSTYLFHFIKRCSPRRLDEQTRKKLAQILAVSEQKLCDYPLNMSIIQDKLTTITGIFGINKEKPVMHAIDVIDFDGKKKGRFEQLKENVISVEYLSQEMVSLYGLENPSTIKIIKNFGDAMSPSISTNDMLWIDTSYTYPSSDGIYLINTPNGVLLRRIQINPFDSSLELIAENTAYKTIIIKKSKDIEICGKALWVVRKL